MYRMFPLQKQIDIEGLYTFFYFEHSRDFKTVGEKHDFWELVYVDSGEVYVVSENDGYILSQGHFILHRPMEFHSVMASNGKPHNILIASFKSDSALMNYFPKKIFELNAKQKKILSVFMDECRDVSGFDFSGANIEKSALTTEQLLSYQMAVSSLERFFVEVIRESSSTTRSRVHNPAVRKNIESSLTDAIKDYMFDNLCIALKLDDMCNHFGLSKSYISQVFKNETGQSVMAYYIDLKIKEAKYMIREGKLNFTQISEKLGYSSLHHFTRIFKKRVKMSPGAYGKSIS